MQPKNHHRYPLLRPQNCADSAPRPCHTPHIFEGGRCRRFLQGPLHDVRAVVGLGHGGIPEGYVYFFFSTKRYSTVHKLLPHKTRPICRSYLQKLPAGCLAAGAYFAKNATKTRGGVARLPLSTSSPPKHWVRVRVRDMSGVGLVWADVKW